MIYFNSEYPIVLNENNRTYYFKKIINDKFLVLYDWNNLIVYNLLTKVKIFQSNIFNINQNWKNNFDINVNSNYVAINYKTQINQYSYNNYFKVWRIEDSGLVLIKDLHYQDNRNFDNSNDFHEMNAKVFNYKNGFGFMRFTGERWSIDDSRENWCSDYQAIKPLRDRGVRYDKIFGRLIAVNFNGTIKENTIDISKTVGEMTECDADGDDRHRRIRHNKKLNNLYFSNDLISNEGIESNTYFFCFSLSYQQSLGKYRKHRRRYRRTCRHWDSWVPEAHYNTECACVFGLDSNGTIFYKNGLTQIHTISNWDSLPGNSMFENFRSNKYQNKFYSAYNSTNEVSLLKFNNAGKAYKYHYNFTNKTIEKFDFNLSDFNGSIDNFELKYNNISGRQLLTVHDQSKSLMINSYDLQLFKNKSYNVFNKVTDIAYAITNDTSTNANDFKIHLAEANWIVANQGNLIKVFKLEDFEYNFKNIQTFGAPKGIEKDNNYIYCTFDFASKKFPILFLRNTTNVVASDFPIQSNIKIFEQINFQSYYENGKNIYFFNQYTSKIPMYDLSSDTNLFKNGNIYSFNLEYKMLSSNKTNSFNQYFELISTFDFVSDNINYSSNQVSFKSDIQNYNQHFYIYLFDINKNLVQESGINFENQNLSIPNIISRSNYNINQIRFNLIGLNPNDNYICILIPYSNSSDKNTFLNKTYKEIKDSNVPHSELNFKTNIVPVIEFEYITKTNNTYKLKVKEFNEDQFSSLKYNLINKNKIWDSNKFEIIDFQNNDSFAVDFLDRDLNDHKNYLTLPTDKTFEIKNVYYDENYIVLINHYDKFKNKFIYNKDQKTDFYIPVPFTYEQLKDPNLNFVKKGLGKDLINEIKNNYADFKDTSYNTGFDYVLFDVPNYKYNQQVVDNYGALKTISYLPNEIINYKVHMIALPSGDLYTIPDKYTPSFKYYYTFNILLNGEEEFSSYKKTLLEAGQIYSYYIEPTFYQDRTDMQMLQMIWDKLKTETNEKHLQNLFMTKGFSYLPKEDIIIEKIIDNSIKLKVPTFEDVLNVNSDLEKDLVSTLDLRMQIFEKQTNKRKIVKFFKLNEFGSQIEINNLSYSEEYYITFNSCLNSSDSSNVKIEEDKKKDFITYPKEISNFEFDYQNHLIENNGITYSFNFSNLNDIEAEVFKLNFNENTELKLNNITSSKINNIFSIKINQSNKDLLFDEVYAIKFYRTKFNLKSKTNEYIVALPTHFKNEVIEIKEKFVDYIIFDLINLYSLKHKNYTSNIKMYLNKKNKNQIDYQNSFTSKDLIKDPNQVIDLKAHNLTPGVIYEVLFKNIWDNQDLINLKFPQYLNQRKKYITYEQDLSGLEIQMDPGKIVNINIERYLKENLYNLEYTFNYYGIACQAKIGFTSDDLNLDENKPFVWHKLNNTNSLSQYYGIIENIGTSGLNFFMEFYEEDKITKINGMSIEEFPRLKEMPRLSMSIYKQQQVYNKGNYTTNSMSFEGVLNPKEADFNIKCISLEDGFEPNITFTSYLDRDENNEDIKRFKFLFNNLEYGYHYSKFKKIQVIAEPNDKNKYLDSFVYDLDDFKLKYPLLKGPKSLEQDQTIKSNVSFNFQKVEGASYYLIQLFYKDINQESYLDKVLLIDKIRNQSNTDVINYVVDKDFLLGSGYYKARITSLNADLEPVEYELNDYSSTYIEIVYFADKIKIPNLITQTNTSELQPIVNWDFKDDVLLETKDKKPDLLLYTDDYNLSITEGSNQWYGISMNEYNLKTLPFKLQQGINNYYFKTYNELTNRYSDVLELGIEYQPENENLIPYDFYINDFYGINKDGLETDLDYKRLIRIPEQFKIEKLEYRIKNSNNETVSSPLENKTIYLGSPYIKEFYIYIDYLNQQLKDGDYLIEFYSFDKKGIESKIFKTSKLKIKTMNISTPKIKLNSQTVI
ncbi:MAG: hypothetical protein ACRCW9_01000 [Cetobacterium sp.]